MIFNDIVDNFNSIEPYIKNFTLLHQASLFILKQSKDLVFSSLANSYITYSNSNYEVIRDKSLKAMDELIKELKRQDLFKLGNLYNQLKGKYNTLFSVEDNYLDIPGESYSKSLHSLIDSIYNFNTSIYNFLNSTNNNIVSIYSTLLFYSEEFYHNYNTFWILKSELNNYITTLENTWDGINKDNTLTIRLFRETITLSEITKYNECIEKMYSIICRLLDINGNDSVLLPVKIETGSLYEKLKGKEAAITLFTTIITFSYTIFHDNFSHMSKLNNQVEQANFIKSKIEIVALAKEQGIEISDDAKSHLEDEITDLLNSSLTLAKNNTKIQINNNTIDLVPQEDLLKFLSETTKPQIESSND